MNKQTTLAIAVFMGMGISASTTWAADTSMEGMDHSQMEGMDHDHDKKSAKDSSKKMDHDKMSDMDHDKMDHGKMDGMNHDDMKGMDHSKMSDMDHGDMKGMDHDKMSGMDHGDMKGMDHDKMSGMDHGDMKGMDHDKMSGMDHGDMKGMDHDKMSGMDHGDMKGMDHGSMSGSMQGGSAPANARDPHANSGGYSIESGKYALPGKRILVLADEQNFASLLVDRFEAVRTSDNTSATYDLQAWYGKDYDRLVIKAEGDIDNGTLEESSTELLWSHSVATFWDAQAGLRFDSSDGGPDRSWLALGIQGLAPYWFELDVTAYVGESGRSALSFEAEYEILFTQKLVLQPRIEANYYGKEDLQLGIGSGLTDVTSGLRLRYEFRREFAPYIGVEWSSLYGNTADMYRAAGLSSSETRAVAGLRFWF